MEAGWDHACEPAPEGSRGLGSPAARPEGAAPAAAPGGGSRRLPGASSERA